MAQDPEQSGMSGGAAAIVRESFDRFEAGNYEGSIALWDDDIELELAIVGETRRGRQQVAEWFSDWFRSFQPGYSFRLSRLRGNDEVAVVAVSHDGVGRRSGIATTDTLGYVFYVRDGLITKETMYASYEEAVQASGLPD